MALVQAQLIAARSCAASPLGRNTWSHPSILTNRILGENQNAPKFDQFYSIPNLVVGQARPQRPIANKYRGNNAFKSAGRMARRARPRNWNCDRRKFGRI
jgi:hypothetical protein